MLQRLCVQPRQLYAAHHLPLSPFSLLLQFHCQLSLPSPCLLLPSWQCLLQPSWLQLFYPLQPFQPLLSQLQLRLLQLWPSPQLWLPPPLLCPLLSFQQQQHLFLRLLPFSLPHLPLSLLHPLQRRQLSFCRRELPSQLPSPLTLLPSQPLPLLLLHLLRPSLPLSLRLPS